MLENATKADIIGTLHQLRSKVQPSDNLLIFYAGHGYWDDGMGVGYWLPRDAAKNNPVLFRMSEMKEVTLFSLNGRLKSRFIRCFFSGFI